MKKSFKKQRLETSIHPQIHKISRITDSNGKTNYLGRKYANNEVVLEQCWIREISEFSEPDFYKQVKTVTCDETQHNTYIVPVGRCPLHKSQYEPNFLDMHSNALTCLGESKKKKERVPDGPTIRYSQGIQNLCIISSLASALYYMGDELGSEYIIRRKQQYRAFIHRKDRMQFCCDTIMGQNREKNNKKYIIKFRNGIHARRHMIYSDPSSSPI